MRTIGNATSASVKAAAARKKITDPGLKNALKGNDRTNAYQRRMKAAKEKAAKAAASEAATKRTEANRRKSGPPAKNVNVNIHGTPKPIRHPGHPSGQGGKGSTGTPTASHAHRTTKPHATTGSEHRKNPTMAQAIKHVQARAKLKGQTVDTATATATVKRRAGKMAAGAKAKYNYQSAVKGS